MISGDTKVKITSMETGSVAVRIPTLNLRRIWPRKESSQTIPFEILEQAIYDPGFEYFLRTGMLFIEDINVRIALGLEEEGATEETAKYVALTDARCEELLLKTPLKEFREAVEKLSLMQTEELINAAIKLRAADYQRCKILEDKTGTKVMSIILRKNEEDEHDGIEANKTHQGV